MIWEVGDMKFFERLNIVSLIAGGQCLLAVVLPRQDSEASDPREVLPTAVASPATDAFVGTTD